MFGVLLLLMRNLRFLLGLYLEYTVYYCSQNITIIIEMSLYQFIIRILARNAIPIGQSIYRAYRHVMKGAHHTTQPRHPMDEFFVRMFETGKDFTTTPPLNQNMALKILDINGRVEDVKAREVLDRYYALYKKNDVENGGSPYLLSKVYSAKECLMERFPNALEEEEKFYNEVVKPEEEAEQAKRKINSDN